MLNLSVAAAERKILQQGVPAATLARTQKHVHQGKGFERCAWHTSHKGSEDLAGRAQVKVEQLSGHQDGLSKLCTWTMIGCQQAKLFSSRSSLSVSGSSDAEPDQYQDSASFEPSECAGCIKLARTLSIAGLQHLHLARTFVMMQLWSCRNLAHLEKE